MWFFFAFTTLTSAVVVVASWNGRKCSRISRDRSTITNITYYYYAIYYYARRPSYVSIIICDRFLTVIVRRRVNNSGGGAGRSSIRIDGENRSVQGLIFKSIFDRFKIQDFSFLDSWNRNEFGLTFFFKYRNPYDKPNVQSNRFYIEIIFYFIC